MKLALWVFRALFSKLDSMTLSILSLGDINESIYPKSLGGRYVPGPGVLNLEIWVGLCSSVVLNVLVRIE